MGEKIFSKLGNVLSIIILFYILIPIIIVYFVSFDAARRFTFPSRNGFSLVHYEDALHSAEYKSSVMTSLKVASFAVGLGLLVGIPAAFAIDRFEFFGKTFVQGMFLAPFMLPQIIWAIGLVFFYANFRASGTFLGLALAHTILVVPFTIRLVLSSLAFINLNLEKAARSLGASPIQTFLKITLPLTAPGILISVAFGFAISFNDAVIATFIAGSRLITYPARMYYQQRTDGLDPMAVAVSAIVMTIILIIALIGEKAIKWSRFI